MAEKRTAPGAATGAKRPKATLIVKLEPPADTQAADAAHQAPATAPSPALPTAASVAAASTAALPSLSDMQAQMVKLQEMMATVQRAEAAAGEDAKKGEKADTREATNEDAEKGETNDTSKGTGEETTGTSKGTGEDRSGGGTSANTHEENGEAGAGANTSGAGEGEATEKPTMLQAQLKDHPVAKGNIPLPGDMTAQTFDRKTRATLWATYQRSQIPAVQYHERADKCPPRIVQEITDLRTANFHFQIWLNCGRRWANVTAFERHFCEKRSGSQLTEAWMIDGQLMQVFQDRVVVDELEKWCNDQVNPIKARQHPRIPHCARARQYSVVIEDHMRERIEQVLQQGINLDTGMDQQSGEGVVRSMLAKSDAVFGNCSRPDSGAQLEIKDVSALPKAEVAPIETDEQKKKAELLERFEKAEQEKADKETKKAQEKADRIQRRRDQQEQERIARIAHAATPQGRAMTWLQGLQEVISKCDAANGHCKSDECYLPANLAREYASLWQNRASAFKRTRTSIENIMKGDKVVPSFEAEIEKAEEEVMLFKSEVFNYNNLEKKYKQQVDKLAEAREKKIQGEGQAGSDGTTSETASAQPAAKRRGRKPKGQTLGNA